ncbi:unnamed protein product [Brassica napus]|uniref:(rape) hypothetical protein n=1 Tax=Brassica napus TaxID=3708 RepID=A0A816R6V5_BRANA|nr:unnamed protein product [Brassica napus]
MYLIKQYVTNTQLLKNKHSTNGSESSSPLLLILHQCRSQISVAYSDTRQKRVFGDTSCCCSSSPGK